MSMLSELRPTLLRFLADPYDDTTSTVFPLLSNILGPVSNMPHGRNFRPDGTTQLKKIKRMSPHEITDDTRAFVAQTLSVILQKMKWDEFQSFDDMDEDDRHAFETLRKVSVLAVCKVAILKYDVPGRPTYTFGLHLHN